MGSGIDPGSNQGEQDPYSMFGLAPGASFEAVQEARDKLLEEVGEDAQARARIEASYDTLLMVSLKDRQLGKVSNAAVKASQKEEKPLEGGGISGVRSSLSSMFQQKSTTSRNADSVGLLPDLSLPEGSGLTIRLTVGILAIAFLLISPNSIDLILAISTLGVFLSQIRKGCKAVSSLGWSVVLLSLGLILGGLLVKVSTLPIGFLTSDQLEAIPALILLWIGSLLLG
ncbi:CPP1-like family protein [Prochlorococcus sp. MIT 1300]|uniref:CPP1-like family protein n=1 Tax=Prochlorococcus sp. MIT 1300 TaxID=3096218 RepID=UPI002A753A0B|nr:CPP1-like family protein [Prochlorococcus sp. MIT 1300]